MLGEAYGAASNSATNSFSQVKPNGHFARIFCTQQVNREINQVNGS